jgi:sugar/nucleoside kinase (ribokinase family)
MTGTFDLLAVGHPSIDLSFSGLEAWPELGRDVDAVGLGVGAGTSFNTPAAANRLGLRVGYVAMIGNDLWSRLVQEEFEREALPFDFLRVRDRPMPFVSVGLNLGGDRGFVSYEGATDEDDDELRRYAEEVVSTVSARHLHVYAGEEPSPLSTLARQRGMSVSFDAWSGPWWESDVELDALLPLADVVFANEPEALAMTGEADLDRAVEKMAALCPCVVIKRGADGSSAVANGERAAAPAEPVPVVDTTGAGDCFNAGFLRAWLADAPLQTCLVLGNVCAAAVVASHGGYRGCPSEAEVREILAARGIAMPVLTGGDVR